MPPIHMPCMLVMAPQWVVFKLVAVVVLHLHWSMEVILHN